MRKLLLLLVLLMMIVVGYPQNGVAGPVKGKTLKNDGKLAVFSYHTRDYVEACYRVDGKYDRDAIKAIEFAMRSRGDDKVHPIEIGVIELMDHLQDHFGAETIEVISGYRSSTFNEELRMSGRGAASESLHTKGRAVDLHIDEVSEQAVFDYVKRLGVGGAGLYPRYAFVHADVGPRRTWQEPALGKRVLVGTDNNPNAAWAAITDKNLYRPGETVEVKITNNGYERMKFSQNIWYERFRKGGWKERERLIKGGKSTSLGTGESTKFSWKIPADRGLGKYRLVFFTSKDLKVPPAYSNEFYIRIR